MADPCSAALQDQGFGWCLCRSPRECCSFPLGHKAALAAFILKFKTERRKAGRRGGDVSCICYFLLGKLKHHSRFFLMSLWPKLVTRLLLTTRKVGKVENRSVMMDMRTREQLLEVIQILPSSLVFILFQDLALSLWSYVQTLIIFLNEHRSQKLFLLLFIFLDKCQH